MKTLPIVMSLALAGSLGLGACTNHESTQSDGSGYGSRAGQEVDDGVLTTKVKSALAAHAALSTIMLHVDSEKGVVTITGTVKSQALYDTISQVAQSVSGVKAVNNQVAIKPEA